MKSKYSFLWLFVIAIFLTGCGGVKEYRHGELSSVSLFDPSQGVYHKVEKGQTLWRIAKAYSVKMDDIVRVNNIPNAALIEENQLLFIPSVQKKQTFLPASSDANSDDFDWPIKGEVTTFFNEEQGIYRSRGIDIRSTAGTKVRASRGGIVVFADYLNGYAQTVILDHQDGFFTVYGNNAHLSVALGDYVVKGQELASIGAIGNHAFLHYEIRENHKASNPLYYLP